MTHTKTVAKWSAVAVSTSLGLALTTPALAHAAPVPAGTTADRTVITTVNGKVRGNADGKVRTFQGIPYAAPPVGALRWKSPRPAARWTGTRDATAPGRACAQPEGIPIGLPNDNEDCLYLNVTTPAGKQTGKRPVIVWIHGGSLMYGAGHQYGGASLAEQGAVVVTVNYRLGVMGFLTDPSQPDADALGLEDQQAALRWVKANAAAFGGDPDNVTIAGQSGGGYSVCGHLASPASAGLFQRAVIQSAPCATGGSRTRAAAEADARRVIATLGCGTNTADCLRHKPVSALLAAYGPYNEPCPVTGTGLMPLSPAEALRTGRFNRVPVLIGVNHDEERGRVIGQELASGAPMKPEEYEPAIRERFGATSDAVLARYPLTRYDSAGEALAAALTDATWSTPTLETARLLARWTPTRMYEFSERDTPWFEGFPTPSFEQHAAHMTELPYLFDHPPLFKDVPADQSRFRTGMLRTWTDFAATGRTAWPRFRTGNGYVQTLSSTTWKRADFTTDHNTAFWKNNH
ncbi:carboxylesterase family protein [Streptomyces sp. NPDC001941]|uniref:carboxylesterase/lipase family protein n=1 Tax=Streptomyces sp. NPDC001941 TaxID=3154659 RepID=UPI003333DF4E